MNKKYLLLIPVLIIIIVLLMLFKGKSYKEALEDISQYKSYELVCNMELLENDELKSYVVTTTYALLNNEDYYKVELYDKSLNQSQTILRNKDGVFVLTPTLNQAFQFQSDWPHNSSKPYIFQSLIQFLKEHEYEKTDKGYLVKGEMKYEHDERIAYQEVYFDKLLNPLSVHIYDQEHSEIIKLEVTSFKTNDKYKEEDFNKDLIIKESKSKYNSVSSSLPLYPVALMGSTLTNEKSALIGDTMNHILKFTGDKAFTIVESASSDHEILEVVKVESEMIDMLDSVAYIDGKQMTYISSGILSSIYSNDLSEEEMLSVLSSMQSIDVK